jgi:FKBP-type peptidyl-prolyl cis-trans isomerase 2/predicted Fe-Mo cluster-binding NifX family protein
MLIAVPSDAPGGLEAAISEHFGHSDVFTLVQVDDGQVGEVTVLANESHQQGGCMSPVMLLADRGAEALVAGGMGARPLQGFQQVGITVYYKEDAQTVGDAVQGIIDGTCREFGQQQTCGGHEGHGCGGHHHHHPQEPVERQVVDGPVEKDRVVRLAYTLTDGSGEQLDASEGIHYLHGHEQVVPGLERALEGHVAGDELEVTLGPEEGYGQRDEERVLQVPIDQLPPGAAPGMMLQAQAPNGAMMQLVVKSVEDQMATLDANHPLAGRTLTFKVKVLQVLAAAPQDMVQ